MAKAAQDINRFLNAGSGAQVQVPGEFIYCKFTESPIRVTIGNTQNSVVMEAGDKIRLEQPFSDFRIENVGDYPTSMVLVVGWGDYWRQIIQGEVSVLPGVRDESGRFRDDTRHDLVIYFEPVIREGYNTQRLEYSPFAVTDFLYPIGLGWDPLRQQHVSGTSPENDGADLYKYWDRAGHPIRTIVVPQYDSQQYGEDKLRPHGLGDVDSRGSLWVPTTIDSDQGDPYGLRQARLWRVPAPLVDYPSRTAWQETTIVRPFAGEHLDAPQAFCIGPDDTFWEKQQPGDGNRVVQYDTAGNVLRSWVPDNLPGAWADMVVTHDRLYAIWLSFPDRFYSYTLDGESLGYEEIDHIGNEGAGIGPNNIGTLTLHAKHSGEVKLMDVEMADDYFSFFGAAVSGGCRAGVGLKRPDVERVRTQASVSVVYQDGQTLASGELVRGILEMYFGRYIRDDYLDHVYKIDFQKGLGADTGARTFAAASQPDNFAAIFPQQVTITVDNGIYQSE